MDGIPVRFPRVPGVISHAPAYVTHRGLWLGHPGSPHRVGFGVDQLGQDNAQDVGGLHGYSPCLRWRKVPDMDGIKHGVTGTPVSVGPRAHSVPCPGDATHFLRG